LVRKQEKPRVFRVTSKSSGSASVADRYATALFQLAEEGKALDAVAEELRRLAEMIKGSDDLKRLIRSPVISRENQSKAMKALLKKAEMSDLTQRFVGLVARNRRLFVLPKIITAYQGILAGRRGETTAEVVSAKALTKAQLASVTDAITKAVGTKVALATSVDQGLLGGLVVKVGSRMVDSSLRTKLQRLRLAMKGIG
jgi:F-type H+-transporting ATPase subunit delta